MFAIRISGSLLLVLITTSGIAAPDRQDDFSTSMNVQFAKALDLRLPVTTALKMRIMRMAGI